MARTPYPPSHVATAVAVWIVAAIAIGASGALQSLRPPAPQIILLTITALLVAAGTLIPRLRAWALTVDERLLVAFHLTRFVGIYFLVLYGRGELPYAFAVPAGWGDIATAVLACGLVATGRPTTEARRHMWIAWNLFGFADIVMVVASAARSTLADPASMAPLLRLPLNLLLTFLVPVIIATHILLFVRLRRAWP